MKYDKYIISFFPGSSGRFVCSVLDRIIRGSDDPLELCPYNSSHLDKTYLGFSMSDPHRPNIYEVLVFDPTNTKDYLFSKICRTHVYPDFKTINSRFNDVGIILIKPNIDDAIEIMFNYKYKNEHIAQKIEILKINHIFFDYPKKDIFFKNDLIEYPENCMVLPYSEIYKKEGENYQLIERLKEFTGITYIPNNVNLMCEQYITNRARIVNQHKLR